jgi:hypothetical protein
VGERGRGRLHKETPHSIYAHQVNLVFFFHEQSLPDRQGRGNVRLKTHNRLFLLRRLEAACYQTGMMQRPNTLLRIIPGLRDRGGA